MIRARFDNDGSFGKHEYGHETKPPTFGATVGAVRPVAYASVEAHHLTADIRYFRDHRVDGHGPLLVLPIIRALYVQRIAPGCRCGIGDERLQERRADVIAVIVAREGPNMVREAPIGPGACQ